MYIHHSGRAFLIAFTAAFFGLSVLGMAAALFVKPLGAPQKEPEKSTENSLYLPQEQDSLTVLFIGEDSEPQGESGTYMLIRFNPRMGNIPILTLPGNTAITYQKKAFTLSSLYEKEGVSAVRRSLEESFGVQVQRSAKVNIAGFEKIVNLIGATSFQSPREITLKQGSVTVKLSGGIQLIDGKKASALALYEGYSSQQERCTLLSNLARDSVNQHLSLLQSDMVQRLFRGSVNNMDTDISFVDYADRRQAIEFLAELKKEPAVAVVPQFVESASNILTIKAESVAVMKRNFGG